MAYLFENNQPGFAVRSTISAAISHRTPSMFGGVGDGTSDDTDAIVAANGVNAILALDAGMVYRVRRNTSVGLILSQGGRLSIDVGVTLTFDDVLGPDNMPVFQGAGRARSRSRHYSVGWWGGSDDFYVLWEATRRAFEADVPQTCVLAPRRDATPWLASAPIQFDDPDNLTTYFVAGFKLKASAPMEAQILISPYNKAEDITFIGDLYLEGQDLANYGVLIKGGARIKFCNGVLRGNRQLVDLFRVETSVAVCDECWVDHILGERYRGSVVRVIGQQYVQSLTVGQITSNGVYSGSESIARVLDIEGDVRGPKFTKVTENCQNLPAENTVPFATTQALVRVAAGDVTGVDEVGGATVYRAPFGVQIGQILALNHRGPLLMSEKGGVATTTYSQMTVDMLSRRRSTAPAAKLAILDWLGSSSIRVENRQSAGPAIEIGADHDAINLQGCKPFLSTIVGRTYNDVRYDGQIVVERDVNDNDYIKVKQPAYRGIIHVHFGTAGDYAVIGYRDDNTSVVISKAGLVDIVSQPTTGTYGTDGHFTIGINGGYLFFENRAGSQRRIHVSVI